MSIHNNYFKKQKYVTLFKKHSKFPNVGKIFYCSMTRHRNMDVDVFTQCQYTGFVPRKKNMGQSLFKRHSKFLILNKVFCCDLAKRGTNNRTFLETYLHKNCCKKEHYETR